MKQKKYLVLASETIIYTIEVKAKSPKEAKEKVLSGEIVLPDACDSDGFQVDDVQIIK